MTTCCLGEGIGGTWPTQVSLLYDLYIVRRVPINLVM